MSLYTPVGPNQTANTAMSRSYAAQVRDFEIHMEILRISTYLNLLDRLIQQRSKDLDRIFRAETGALEELEEMKKESHNLVQKMAAKIAQSTQCAKIVHALGEAAPTTRAEESHYSSSDNLNGAANLQQGAASQSATNPPCTSRDPLARVEEPAQWFGHIGSVMYHHDCGSEEEMLSGETYVVSSGEQEECYQCSIFGHGSEGCRIFRNAVTE